MIKLKVKYRSKIVIQLSHIVVAHHLFDFIPKFNLIHDAGH